MLPTSISDHFLKLLKSNEVNDCTSDKIEILLLTLLRFSSIDEVDALLSSADQSHRFFSQLRIKERFKDIKRMFLSLAPYFSRYSNVTHLDSLYKSYYHDCLYKNHDQKGLSIWIDKSIDWSDLSELMLIDLRYGRMRRNLACELVKQLKEGTLKPKCKAFNSLPVSMNENKNVAALMEQIASWNYNYQENNNRAQFNDDFRNLRAHDNRWRTPVCGRYQYGKSLTEAAVKHSKSAYMNYEAGIYSLHYPLQNQTLTLTQVRRYYGELYWFHGQAPISATWGRIENLFEEILSMNIQDDKANLRAFYSNVAELVWLIGNTQPMSRGSGSVAEILLAVTHLYHGLNPPTLKLHFPQLDVLDISFPVDDYKRMFPWFFEPQSLPKELGLEVITPCENIEDELDQIYEKAKNNDSMVIDAPMDFLESLKLPLRFGR